MQREARGRWGLAGQIVLFDISGHDHLGGGGACRVQGGRQPDEHHQLKGENQCFYPGNIKNVSHFGLQENIQGDFGSYPVQYRNEKMLASQSDLLTQFLKSTTAATILGGPKPKNKIAECQNICSQI